MCERIISRVIALCIPMPGISSRGASFSQYHPWGLVRRSHVSPGKLAASSSRSRCTVLLVTSNPSARSCASMNAVPTRRPWGMS